MTDLETLRHLVRLAYLRYLLTGEAGPGLATSSNPKLRELGRLLAEYADRHGITAPAARPWKGHP